jgi:hypothetical protein
MRAASAWLIGLALLAGICWAVPALAADAPSATPEQLAALDEVLARPEFQLGMARSLFDPIREWVRDMLQAIQAFLDRLLGPVREASNPVILLTAIVVSLAVVIGAALMLPRLVRGTIAGDANLAEALTIARPRASDELAQARALAQAGQLRRALHHQYRAVVLRLDEREHLPFDSTLTNRELVPRLTAAPDLAEPFAELVTRFDRLWYGQTDCSADEYAAFDRLALRVWQAADAIAPPRTARQDGAGSVVAATSRGAA